MKPFFNLLSISLLSFVLLFLIGCNNPVNSKENENQTVSIKYVDNVISSNDCTFKVTKENDIFINTDNTVYSRDIANLSILLASSAYDFIEIKEINGESVEKASAVETLYKELGFQNLEVDLIPNVTKVYFAHKECKLNDKDYSIVVTAVQGTNGTYEQWESNFDIGADTQAYYDKCGNDSDWKNKKNHKGFDVAANKVNSLLVTYLKNYIEPKNSEVIMLFTGHSRGAAIANILGAKYEKEDKTFTYTFATPNTTTDKEAASEIKTVFNIINLDDIVTVMPQPDLGFVRYGTNKEISINEYSEKWNKLTGQKYVSAGAKEKISEGGALTGIAPSREAIYEITDDDINKYKITLISVDEDGTNKTVLTSEEVKDFLKSKNLAKYTSNLKTSADGFYIEGNICAEYPMQIIPCIISAKNSGNLLEIMDIYNKYIPGLNSKYQNILMGFISAGMSGMKESHTPTSYFLAVQEL